MNSAPSGLLLDIGYAVSFEPDTSLQSATCLIDFGFGIGRGSPFDLPDRRDR